MGERNARSNGTHTQRINALNWSSSISELQYPGSVTQRDSGQCSSVVWLAIFGALLRGCRRLRCCCGCRGAGHAEAPFCCSVWQAGATPADGVKINEIVPVWYARLAQGFQSTKTNS